MFTGEYSHSIDVKGRITIPSKFREELGDECVVSRGFEGCLNLYSQEEWRKFSEFLTKSSLLDPNVRKLQRVFLATSITCTYDKQGRILLTNELRERAGLEKDVMVVGVGNRIELWAKENWLTFSEIKDEDISDIAASIFPQTMEGWK